MKLELKMKLFDSLVCSVMFYSLETVPWKKHFEDTIRNCVVKCYKQILNIDHDIRVEESDLTDLLGVKTIHEQWKRKRLNAVSHIASLPYDNPARIVLFGSPIFRTKVKKRRFKTLNKSLMDDVNEILNNDTYCNLCNRKFRSAVYT